MSHGPIMAYFFGGPHDLTKKQLAQEPEFYVFEAAPDLHSIPESEFGKPFPKYHRYVRVLAVPRALIKTDMPVVIYGYWGCA